ncbi:hypothetical protein QQ045_017431 [Rhodiola kirilowii]
MSDTNSPTQGDETRFSSQPAKEKDTNGDETEAPKAEVVTNTNTNTAVFTNPIDTIVPSVVPRGIDGSASTEEHNEEMHSSDLQIPEEFAQKITSFGSELFYCADIEGPADARAIYLHYRTGCEDDKIIYEDLDGFIKENRPVEQEGSGIPIEESERGYDDQ